MAAGPALGEYQLDYTFDSRRSVTVKERGLVSLVTGLPTFERREGRSLQCRNQDKWVGIILGILRINK